MPNRTISTLPPPLPYQPHRIPTEGLTHQAIADRLNAEGFKTAQGKAFHPTQVWRVRQRRELYQGRYSFGGVKADRGPYVAILTPSQVEAV